MVSPLGSSSEKDELHIMRSRGEIGSISPTEPSSRCSFVSIDRIIASPPPCSSPTINGSLEITDSQVWSLELGIDAKLAVPVEGLG